MGQGTYTSFATILAEELDADWSIDPANDEVVRARIFDKTTSDLANLAQPGRALGGIQESNAGKVVVFGGLYP